MASMLLKKDSIILAQSLKTDEADEEDEMMVEDEDINPNMRGGVLRPDFPAISAVDAMVYICINIFLKLNKYYFIYLNDIHFNF